MEEKRMATKKVDYFGLPNEESLKKSDEAMRLFMDQMQYGFVHEVIEANNLA